MDVQVTDAAPQTNTAHHAAENAPKKKSRTRRGRRGKRRRGKKANEPPPFLPPEVNTVDTVTLCEE